MTREGLKEITAEQFFDRLKDEMTRISMADGRGRDWNSEEEQREAIRRKREGDRSGETADLEAAARSLGFDEEAFASLLTDIAMHTVKKTAENVMLGGRGASLETLLEELTLSVQSQSLACMLFGAASVRDMIREGQMTDGA